MDNLPYSAVPGSARSLSPNSFWSTRDASSSFLFARKRISFDDRTYGGVPTILLNCGRGILSTSPSITETVGLFSNSFRRCETSLRSFSTASTRPACSSRRWVRVPYPAPGSRTVSVRVSSAVDTTLEAMCLSARKFWPSLFTGRYRTGVATSSYTPCEKPVLRLCAQLFHDSFRDDLRNVAEPSSFLDILVAGERFPLSHVHNLPHRLLANTRQQLKRMHSRRNRLRIVEEFYKPFLLTFDQFRDQGHDLSLRIRRELVVADPRKNSVNLLPPLAPNVDSLVNQHSSANLKLRLHQGEELFTHDLDSRNRQMPRLLRRPAIRKIV